MAGRTWVNYSQNVQPAPPSAVETGGNSISTPEQDGLIDRDWETSKT